MLETKATGSEYQEFLERKRYKPVDTGIDVTLATLNSKLKPFQAALTQWALRKGRAALFADTGLGKTLMQLEWARLVPGPVLVLAPLAVAQQTVKEAAKFGLECDYARSMDGSVRQITITNYEMVDHFDVSQFTGVVLDESSILKAYDGKTRTKLIELFRHTQYRLCCTATPAPNDITEIANHAEFLGVKTRAEMLAEFFVHDDDGWRLKGHAADDFYRWMSTWSMSIKSPEDIGFDGAEYELPPLTVTPHMIDANSLELARAQGQLFPMGLAGVTGRQAVRRKTLPDKVAAAAETINASNEQWVVWCGLNDEGRQMRDACPDAVLVEGADSLDSKIASIMGFIEGRHRVLISKTSICGFGLNLQNCHNMLFLGLSDSYESYYQAIRRSWRFGQESPVNVTVVLAEIERPILENVQRKEQEAAKMTQNIINNVTDYERQELGTEDDPAREYREDIATGADWTLMLGDCVARLQEVADESVDFSVFSPPFMSLYTYSDSDRDFGNCRDDSIFFEQFGYLAQELYRTMKPGRIVACHVAQVAMLLARDGVIGIKDFRGKVIEAFQSERMTYYGDVTIDKNPQAQAIRTHSKALLFAQLKKDASWLRPGLADYLLIFRKPGDNAVAIHPDISNEDWIKWAHPVWTDIRESNTLNVREGRENKDERHIAPLQLGLINRAIRLWSNPGETVLSPFAGIGSEGHEAIKLGRKFVGVELKGSYYQTAIKNLQRAETEVNQQRML
jgi:DNA modification methylase